MVYYTATYFDFRTRNQWRIIWLTFEIALYLAQLLSNQLLKLGRDVTPKEGFVGGNGKQGGEKVGIEGILEQNQSAVHTGSA